MTHVRLESSCTCCCLLLRMRLHHLQFSEARLVGILVQHLIFFFGFWQNMNSQTTLVRISVRNSKTLLGFWCMLWSAGPRVRLWDVGLTKERSASETKYSICLYKDVLFERRTYHLSALDPIYPSHNSQLVFHFVVHVIRQYYPR